MIRRKLWSLFILLVGDEDVNHSKPNFQNGIKNGIKTLNLLKFSSYLGIKMKKDLTALWKDVLGWLFLLLKLKVDHKLEQKFLVQDILLQELLMQKLELFYKLMLMIFWQVLKMLIVLINTWIEWTQIKNRN